MNYTDTQLKHALAKMLPETVHCEYYMVTSPQFIALCWKRQGHPPVLDTELLHLCWLLEETLNDDYTYYAVELDCIFNLKSLSATWQQRVIALCKVKGIEI
jgi:hypothetical protein